MNSQRAPAKHAVFWRSEIVFGIINREKLLHCFQGHSVNVLTIDHVTPLHEACVGDHAACARALIDAGANVGNPTALISFTLHFLQRRSTCQQFADVLPRQARSDLW